MKNEDTVFVVTGVHNNIEDTKKFLECLEKSDYPKIKSVIVDGGSTDGTPEYIKTKFPNITLIECGGDLWWTGSIKRAIEWVLDEAKSSDYILTINDDCIFNETYISSLIDKEKRNKGAIIGSLVLDLKTKKVVDSGVKINWEKAIFEPILKSDNKRQNKLINVDVLSTKGTIFPVDVFYKIGNFDDKNFPHYLSDYEFTLRAKEKKYNLYIYYGSVLFNDSNRTGVEFGKNTHLSKSDFHSYLFSRKSKMNISDQFKFFYFHCPQKYRLRCGLSMLGKAVYLLSLFGPFYYLRQIFIKQKNV